MTTLSDPFRLDPAALDECAREPIHIPGHIQGRGVLLAFDPALTRVAYASANAAALFGVEQSRLLARHPEALLGAPLCQAIRSVLTHVADGTVVTLGDAGHAQVGEGRVLLAHRHDGLALLEIVEEAPPGRGQRHALQYAEALHRITASMTDSSSLEDLCASVATELRQLTGYDRTMVYRFDRHGHGSVIGEARREELEPFLGLHYPASDIPAQARALYLRTRVRVLDDVASPPVPLLPAPGTPADRPLDLSYALLRSLSPVHHEYLRNMGVRAALVVSILVDGALWGLIACHHGEPKWPTTEMREACDLCSEFVSLQVAIQERRLRSQARAQAEHLLSGLIRELIIAGERFDTVLAQLAALVPCSGAALVSATEVRTTGATPTAPRIRDLVACLTSSPDAPAIHALDHLGADHPAFAPLADVASGVLHVALGGADDVHLLWFRPSEGRTVRWAGRPEAKAVPEGGMRLSPRGSFAEWVEETRGASAPWGTVDLEMAEATRSADHLLEWLATRHRVAQLALRRIEAAVEASSDAVALADPEGRVVYVNPAFTRILGYSRPGLVVSGGLSALLAPPDAPFAGEVALRARDGTMVPVHLRVDPVCDDHGEVVSYLYSATDLRAQRALEEERRHLEQQVLEAQKLESLGVLAGGIAHDFNNLLTTIVGNVVLTLEDLPPASPVREGLDEISSAAERAADLCRQLLAYAGRGRFQLKAVDLNMLIAEMTGLLRTAIGETCTAVFRLGPDLPAIQVDPAQLRQLVRNLIINAAEAIGPASGVIAITTRERLADRDDLDDFLLGQDLPPGRYLSLEVSDTGPGMDDETMARVFEPFFTTKFTGRGLGLAAVQGIVRAHGGALRIASEVGRGTSCMVLLPVTPAPALP